MSLKISVHHVSRKAFRKSLENDNGSPLIIFLSDEKFAGQAWPDRLLFGDMMRGDLMSCHIFLFSLFSLCVARLQKISYEEKAKRLL